MISLRFYRRAIVKLTHVCESRFFGCFFECYRMNAKCLERLIDSHECTQYNVGEREAMSYDCTPARCLRDGCLAPPILGLKCGSC